MKQKTIGLNPLEEYLSRGKEPVAVSEKAPEVITTAHVTPLVLVGEPMISAEPAPVVPEEAALKGKQRITLHISAEVIDRLKNAVYWEPGLTLAGFAEEALEKALNEMEEERGKPFPQRRQHRLKGGRPIL